MPQRLERARSGVIAGSARPHLQSSGRSFVFFPEITTHPHSCRVATT